MGIFLAEKYKWWTFEKKKIKKNAEKKLNKKMVQMPLEYAFRFIKKNMSMPFSCVWEELII